MTPDKKIFIKVYRDRSGYSRVEVDVLRPDNSVVDTYRQESIALKPAELWEKYGPAAVLNFREMYKTTGEQYEMLSLCYVKKLVPAGKVRA